MLQSALNKAGIELDKYYSVQDIKDALGDAYPGVQAELTCHPSRRGRGIRRADCPGSKCGLLDSVSEFPALAVVLGLSACLLEPAWHRPLLGRAPYIYNAWSYMAAAGLHMFQQ